MKEKSNSFLGCCCCFCCCCFLFFLSFFFLQNLISFRWPVRVRVPTGTDTKRLTRSRQFQMSRNARAADDDRDQESPTDRIFLFCFKGSGRIEKKQKLLRESRGHKQVRKKFANVWQLWNDHLHFRSKSCPTKTVSRHSKVVAIIFFWISKDPKDNVTCPLNSFAITVNSCKMVRVLEGGNRPRRSTSFTLNKRKIRRYNHTIA